MIADSERRAIAARLRMLQRRQFRDEERPEVTTWEGIGAAVLPDDEWQRIDRFRSRDNRTRAVRSVIAGRLADMIEPNPDICAECPERKLGADEARQAQAIARHVVREVDAIACDRKALLALADEMDAYSGHFSTGLQECTVQAWAVAIREALGSS